MKKSKAKKAGLSKKIAKPHTLNISNEHDIAYDFGIKVYEKFDKIVKSVILFGSTAKRISSAGSDIDIIIIIDDCTVQWDEELTAWYREELGKLIASNPYKKALHINSVRLSTWWTDLMRGDPVVINIIRWGEAIVDFGGFYSPFKVLLEQGKIKSTPEAIYTALQRAPMHMMRSKVSIVNAMEGLYWACVDSAHAALIAAKRLPPSPEQITEMLKEEFADKNMLDDKYIIWYRDLYLLAHKILHGTVKEISGREIDLWTARTDEFVRVMAQLIKKIV